MNDHFIKNIEIKNFKCFEDFTAEGFGRVNLIGGKNNVGKTAFMEACYINSEACMSLAFANIIFARYSQHFFSKLLEESKTLYVFNFIKEESKKYKNTIINSNQKNIAFNYDEKELVENSKNEKVQFLANSKTTNKMFEDFYAPIQMNKIEHTVDNYLNQFDSNIDSFRIIKSEPKISLKSDNNFYSINEFGEGIGKYLTFILSLYSLKNSYVFIDEIDNGIHHTNLDELWEIILTVSKEQNVQVFATTHSKECIESYARVAKKLADEEVTYSLLTRLKSGKLHHSLYDYALLENAIIEQAHEVR